MSEPALSEQVYLVLRDTNPEMVMGWLEHFSGEGPWSIGAGSILREKGDAIFSPANSYGYMDGGIDLAYRTHFGPGIQTLLQRFIHNTFGGMLPVGEAVIIPTQNDRIPRMIAAPTMERPSDVKGTQNAYLAMRAGLLKVTQYNRFQRARNEPPIRRILIPGLCTGIGQMDPFESAAQMRRAFDEVEREGIPDLHTEATK
jgi:O-acetyl-ADP-ribose deacetylase (regulator of RNase III)